VAAAGLIAALTVAALAAPSAAAELRWTATAGAAELHVAPLPVAALDRLDAAALAAGLGERLLRVVAVPAGSAADPATLPSQWGGYAIDGEALVFRPRHAPSPGVELVARFDGAAFDAAAGARGTASLELRHRPAASAATATRVIGVAPSGDEIPANLLRLYVEFSAPMSLRDVAREVRLHDARGAPIADAFVEVPEGLWDPDRRRLTLLVHPGRVKRGVGPGEALGPVLREGESVRLEIGGAARDADGRTLAAPFARDYRVGPPLAAPIDPGAWELAPPESPEAPLAVASPVPFDRALARRLLAVIDARGETVPGEVEVELGERRLLFRPAAAWRAGERYRLVAAAALEDPCGNRIGRAFDREIGEDGGAPVAAERGFVPSFSVAAAARR
jgi:hypothetical protein